MQHIEFFDTEHFEHRYHRVAPPPALAHFIDFFWETDFEFELIKHPGGFSDVLFPNTGYTYLVNLGTPYVMQLGNKKIDMKGDGYLPRHQAIECYHNKGNHLFGIKFRVSPVLFEKKVNFSEYREYIFPLSYLIDPAIIAGVKTADSFTARTRILSNYYEALIFNRPADNEAVNIVLQILDYSYQANDFLTPVAAYAKQYNVSARTLQRYFELTTGVSPRHVLQIMRIRRATESLVSDPLKFNHSNFGYYDHSHFYKHLKQFLTKPTITHMKPHVELLKRLHNVPPGN
ncbi:MAG: AraC family transcriptional regulator [Chitinophagaceae bacterium]|nr:MAG: AraC family transcriptional regulator [Chitinophagaceae bacterium]